MDPLVFGAGSDLWIVPERNSSHFVQKMDWLLNFQISKATQHQSPTLPKQVLQILENAALKDYDWAPSSNDSLLILSSQCLPNRWVMVLRGSDRIETWAEQAVQKWKKMKSPSVRVFLPHGTGKNRFADLWKKSGGTAEVVIIEDRE